LLFDNLLVALVFRQVGVKVLVADREIDASQFALGIEIADENAAMASVAVSESAETQRLVPLLPKWGQGFPTLCKHLRLLLLRHLS